MILWKLIVGIVLLLCSIALPCICVIRTPDNLRGFYGAMFWIIALAGIIGGITLAVTAFV